MISIIFLPVCPGQTFGEIQIEENWLKEYDLYYEPFVLFRYDRYSREDVVKFREKLDLLKDAKFDEWEGIYTSDLTMIGTSQFHWKADVGFASLYVYSCQPELRYLNYGKIANSPDSIQVIPEYAANSPRKISNTVRYVKIKWNDRHYLVEESSVSAFAEKAVGIFVEPDDAENENFQKWTNYWVMGDLEKDLTGLPEFPANYKKFQRVPIETKIIAVGKRSIDKEIELGGELHTAESAVYPVTLDAGKTRGVKIGMRFFTADGDEIVITEVSPNRSNGVIVRVIDDEDADKSDLCFDDDGNKTACPQIKNSLKVTTKIGAFFF